MHYAIARQKNDFVTVINEKREKYSDIDSLINHVVSFDESAVFIRDDRMIRDENGEIDSLHDFDSMNRDENSVIHARAHSRRNAYRVCAYCVRVFIFPADFADVYEQTYVLWP